MKASKLLARAAGFLQMATPPPPSKPTAHDGAVDALFSLIEENKPALVTIRDKSYDPDEQAICVEWEVSEFIESDKINVRVRKWFKLPLYVAGVPAPEEANRLLTEFLNGWLAQAQALHKRLVAI